jgi:hypothetical protein
MTILKNSIQTNEIKSPNLFTNISQRELWDEVYNYCNKNGQHAVIIGKSNFIKKGNSGIGKSRSLIYFLKKLLKDGKNVIFEIRKDKKVYSFVYEDGKYCVYSIDKEDFRPQSDEILNDSNNYYLIDPDKPEQIVNVKAHTILVASPNRQHYHEYSKNQDLSKWCMATWEENDAKLLKKYIKFDDKELTDEEFNKRYYKFGGILRHIFSSEIKIKDFEDNLENAINYLNFEELVRSFSHSEIDQKYSNISSYLFKYHVNKIDGVYKYLKSSDNVTTLLSSNYVKKSLAIKWGKEIIDGLLNPKSKKYENNSGIYAFFEIISKILIQIGGEFKIKQLYSNDNIELLKLEESEAIQSKSQTITSYFEECKNLEKGKLLYPKITNIPIIEQILKSNLKKMI